MSLKYKFSLLVIFIVVSTLLVVCSVLAYRGVKGIEGDLQVRDRLVSENLLPGLLSSFGDYYSYQYDNYIASVKKSLSEHPDLVYFRVINADSEMVFETTEIAEGRTKGNPPKEINDPEITKVIQTRKPVEDFIVVNGIRQLRVITPYIDNYDTFRNLVEFRFSLHEIENTINETILFFVVFLFAFSIIGVAVAIFFVGLITKPLVKLTVIAGKVTAGDLSQQAEIESNDEVGTLATSFNLMVGNLKQKIEQLHSEQIKLEASINSLSVGFIMVDRDNNILTINQKARQTFCASPTSPLATIESCTFLHIEEELKSVINLRAYITKCLTEKTPVTIKELSFQNRYLKIFITPIITIGVIGAVVLIDDITEAKVMERSKEEFFSIASHELRTPLTAIRGNSSMIQQFYAEKITDPNLADMIQDIHESSVRLIEIVNDFLDTSRLEMGKMVFKKEAFDIIQLAQDTIKEYMTTGSMKKLYLKIDNVQSHLPPVFADKNKVKQVLINLIGNAIKFTEVGGITLKMIASDKFVKVLIIDTGRGISVESQNLLFRKFQQAQDNLLTRDTTRGTGLGLYISRLIMQGMGGEVKIESSEMGHGTTFSITLPIAPPASAVQPGTTPTS